jgi:hypothetical protein
MSTEAEHLALANRNQAVLDHLLLDVSKCSEWVFEHLAVQLLGSSGSALTRYSKTPIKRS